MKEKNERVKICSILIVIHAFLFILMNKMADISLLLTSGRNILSLLLWFALFVVIFYLNNNNMIRSLKNTAICVGVWAIIETVLEWVVFYLFNFGINSIGYMLYGLEITLCLISVLFFAMKTEEKSKSDKQRKIMTIMGIVFGAYLVITLLVCTFVPEPDLSSLLNESSFTNYLDVIVSGFPINYQEQIMKIIINVFYATEGSLFIQYHRNESCISK